MWSERYSLVFLGGGAGLGVVLEEDGEEEGELPPLPDEPLSSLGWDGPAVTSKSVFSLDILNSS